MKAMEPKRRPRRITPDYLERAALDYLERFSTSSARLRRVLTRRVERSSRAHGTGAAEGIALIDRIIERFERSGILNDKRFAESATQSLHRRGASQRAIEFKLRSYGLAPALIREAKAQLASENENSELEAAFALARRRRLGPFRRDDERADREAKDFASLLRAGFPPSIARTVIRSPNRSA